MDTYNKIDTELKRMNKTRADMCNETGLSYNTIASLFKRKSENISLEVLRIVAKYLGVSLDYLIYDEIKDRYYGKKKDPAPEREAEENSFTSMEKELMGYLDQLNVEQKKLLLDQIKLMNEQKKE